MACSVLVQAGMVDGRGYNGQQEDAICGQMIQSNSSQFSLIPTDWLRL